MSNKAVNSPALLVSAPASGQGKTTVTAALARHYRRQGLSVRVFKTGPDFIDPMILEMASGHPVYQLDLWMVGEQACRELLYQAACEADVILVEGVMGLFDGDPSSADLAMLFGLPVLGVIDASAMAQTFGALAHGLASYRPGLNFIGVLANRVGSARHGAMLAPSLPPGMRYYGHLLRDEDIGMPERHLGLLQAQEITDLDARLELAAENLACSAAIELPPPACLTTPEIQPPPLLLAGQRIGIARDAAFSFIYPANIDLLQAMGAELVYFSPLTDSELPQVDSLWLPGGYPELHAADLASNYSMAREIKAHHAEGKPIVAECGGMLYLLDSLTDLQGQHMPMLGLLAGSATMQQRLGGLGMQTAVLPWGAVRGHTFHYSRMESPLSPFSTGIRRSDDKPGEAVYYQDRLYASYIHLYFPSNPEACARLLLTEQP